MNRVGIFKDISVGVPNPYDSGELSIIASNGEVLAVGNTGPFKNPTMVDLVVGLKDGSAKEVITINPRNFKYKVSPYVVAVGHTVRIGYNGVSKNIVLADPTLASNVGKYGTVWFHRTDLKSGVIPKDTFHKDVEIIAGDSVATVLARLVAQVTLIVADINAKYGAGSVSITSSVGGANKYIELVFAKNKVFSVTIDGIFDGTAITVTAGTGGPFVSGLTGVEVQAIEKEAAVLDGYNPVQTDKKQLFNINNYVCAEVGTNYDAILITTRLPKEYNSPGNPEGWDVTAILYTPNTTPGTLGEKGAALEAILKELAAVNMGDNYDMISDLADRVTTLEEAP